MYPVITNVGVSLSIERYNTLLESESLAKQLPVGVLLRFVHYDQTFAVYVAGNVTLEQLAEAATSLFRLPWQAKLLQTVDGTVLEPPRTVADVKLRHGDKLFTIVGQ